MKRILQNSFGKTILCLLVALMSGGTAWAQMQERVYKTAQFGRNYNSADVINYTRTWTATYDNFTVTLSNFANASGFTIPYVGDIIYNRWSYVACGGTNSPATITTAAPIDEPITKVDLNITRANNVNSIILQASMDYATWDDVGTFATGIGTKEVPIPEDMRNSNLFYRIVVSCTGNGEDDVRISQVRFYREVPDPNAVATPVISGTEVFESSTSVTITCTTADAAIQYSLDGGNSWTNYGGAISLTETTTVKAKATKGNQTPSQVASKTFTKQSDVRDVTWDLTKEPTGAKSNSQVTWTTTETGEYFAVMSLSKSSSSTNANAYLGGTNNHTKFYQNQILRIAPLDGYSIVFVEIETTNGTAGLNVNSWSNAANTSVTGNKVKITPQDGMENLSVIISAMTQVTGVNVEYTPIFHPVISIAEDAVSATSAGKEGNIEVAYERIDKMSAVEVLVADENHEQAGEGFWLTAELDDDYNLTYTIAPNTTTEVRTAYIAVHVGENIYSNVVTVTQEAAIKVTIAWIGYSSLYYSDKNLKLPAGVTAQTFKKGEIRMVESHYYANADVIPAGTAVILKGEPGDYAFVETTASGYVDNENELKGSDEAALTEPGTDDYYYYVLSIKKNSNDPSTVGFYWNNSTGGPFTSAAHRAYLPLPKSSDVKSYYVLGEEVPTGINEVEFKFNDDEVIYNLAGQRIQKMQKGINIVNGKKILK